MAKKEAVDARHYDVILAPHITEKVDHGVGIECSGVQGGE